MDSNGNNLPGKRKLWHHRKAKLAASQNRHQANIENQPNANNPPGVFNNAIHNSDVTSFKNIFLFCLIAAILYVIKGIFYGMKLVMPRLLCTFL